jgi:hypothetical protein
MDANERIYELEKKIAVLMQMATDGDKALELAMHNLSRRLDEMNQFRQQINEERNTFLSKESFEIKYASMESSVNKLSSWRSNMEGRFWALGAGIAAFVVALQIALKWLSK